MLPHLDTLSWYQANQYMVFLHNATGLLVKQHIPMLLSGLTQSELYLTIYSTQDKHANHYTIYAIYENQINTSLVYCRWSVHYM